MSLIGNEALGRQWNACWPVFQDAAPGITLATALTCMHPVDTGRGHSHFTFVVDERPQRVLWIGWAPDIGIVRATSDWLPKKGIPKPPAEGWKSHREMLEEMRAKARLGRTSVGAVQKRVPPPAPDPRNRPIIYHDWGGLPFPIRVGRLRLYQEQANELRAARDEAFVRMLPEGTADCMKALESAAAISDRGWPVRKQQNWEHADWLLGSGAQGAVDWPEAGRRRRQFVMSHPILGCTSVRHDLERRIDDGYETVPDLAKALRTEERVIRALARIPPASRSVANEFVHSPLCLPLLEGMAPSWLPALETLEPGGWKSLTALSHAIASDLSQEPRQVGGWRGRNGSASHRAATEMARHLGSTLAPDGASGLNWLAPLENTWTHLGDAVDSMARELVLPALARTSPDQGLRATHTISVQDALASLGARKLARILNAHLAGVVHDARLGIPIENGGHGDGWGEAARPATAPGGKILRFLANQTELTAEGAAMGHCVGTYGAQCADRECAILSVGKWGKGHQRPVWQPTSTIEVRVEGDGSPWVRQHYGPGNGFPPREDRQAADWWLDEVKAKRIALREGAIRHRVSGSPRGTDLPGMLGAAWRTPDAHVHRWDRWRRLLGTRSHSFGDWLLALPPVFLSCRPRNALVAELALDMDAEMGIAREIEMADIEVEMEAEAPGPAP